MTEESAITWEWTHEERPCRCTPEHRPFCRRCGGTGVRRLARLRQTVGFDDVVANPPFQAEQAED